MISNDAEQQFTVVVANNNDHEAQIQVLTNAGGAGEAYREEVVLAATVGPRSVRQLDQPQCEGDGTMGRIDGRSLGEFADCVRAPIGTVLGTGYEQVTCRVSEGGHTVEGDQSFGLFVYGYYSVGSYSFAGGSDVKIINPID